MSWKNWKTIPIVRPRQAASCSSVISSRRLPATVTVPAVGRSMAAMRLTTVDLPLPDGIARPHGDVGGGARGQPVLQAVGSHSEVCGERRPAHRRPRPLNHADHTNMIQCEPSELQQRNAVSDRHATVKP